MVHKYQNEISPTMYYGISTKTNEKDLKIPNLQPPYWKHPYWMTLYIEKLEHIPGIEHFSDGVVSLLYHHWSY